MDSNKLSGYFRTIGDAIALIGVIVAVIILIFYGKIIGSTVFLYSGMIIFASTIPYMLGNGLAEIIDLLVDIRYELKQKSKGE